MSVWCIDKKPSHMQDKSYNKIMRYFYGISIVVFMLSSLPIQAQIATNELFFQPQVAFNGNFSLVSNYLFRGESLSDDKPAVQGGLNYNSPTGFYLGAWATSGDASMPLEIDLYGAYKTNINASLTLEAKLIGFIFPHASDDDSLEVELSTYIYDVAFRYSYDFVLEQQYLEAGLRSEFSTVFWGLLRGGLLLRNDVMEARIGSVLKNTNEINIWDIELNLGYSLSQKSSVTGEFVYHETEGASAAISYTVLFNIM